MSNKNTKKQTDGTRKRVRTEVSDSSTSDEESKTNNYNISTDNWPRFLIIEPVSEGELNSLSPFAIHKALQGFAGELKSVKRILKNGRLLVECLKQHHSKCLLKSKVMCNIPIKVSAHTSLNSSKGVIRSRDLEGVGEVEMLDNLSSQGVSAVKRIHIRRNNELVPTNTFILTFCKPLLPDSIKAGYLKIPVVPFIPNPLRCFKLFHRYGHGKNACRGKVTCVRCGQVDHESKTCNNAISCANCKGSHFAYSRECSKWKQEKQVQQVRVEKQVSFPETRRLVETRSGAVAGKSYATAVKVSTTNVSVQTDLTKRLIPYFPLMTNGLRPNFDELSILIVKHNPLAVCLQETFLKDTENITLRGFNLYHKCQETENRASGGVSILVNENVPQSIVTLNTNLQAVVVKVTAHKTITLCSVYLPPRNHFNFNPKDLQDAIDQLPSPFVLMEISMVTTLCGDARM